MCELNPDTHATCKSDLLIVGEMRITSKDLIPRFQKMRLKVRNLII